VGNDSNPAAWISAPAPTSVSQRTVGGATRVTVIWADGAIGNQWLQVTVLANATTTGLPAADVFYFGNAMGETGNHATAPGADAVVDAADEAGARSSKGLLPSAVTNRYDFNRDRRIDAADELVVRANYRSGSAALQLINLGTSGAVAGAAVAPLAAVSVSASPTAPQQNASSATADVVPAPAKKQALVPKRSNSASHGPVKSIVQLPPARKIAAHFASVQPMRDASRWGWLLAANRQATQPAVKRDLLAQRAVDQVLAARLSR
jgi:hypothetical protein